MGQSLTKVLVHLVFSTKDRKAYLDVRVRPEVHGYLIGALGNLDSPSLAVGGTADHIHCLCRLSKNLALAELLMELKTSSSKWLHTKGSEYAGFHWQTGYGAFSVSESNADAVIRYIQRQDEHHQRRTFKEELLALLEKCQVKYDERYLWD